MCVCACVCVCVAKLRVTKLCVTKWSVKDGVTKLCVQDDVWERDGLPSDVVEPKAGRSTVART